MEKTNKLLVSAAVAGLFAASWVSSANAGHNKEHKKLDVSKKECKKLKKDGKAQWKNGECWASASCGADSCKGNACKGDANSCKGEANSCKGEANSCKGEANSCKGEANSCKGEANSCKGEAAKKATKNSCKAAEQSCGANGCGAKSE